MAEGLNHRTRKRRKQYLLNYTNAWKDFATRQRHNRQTDQGLNKEQVSTISKHTNDKTGAETIPES